MILHWSLSEIKFPLVSRILLYFTDLKNAVVWMVSVRPLCIYHLVVRSNFNFRNNSPWITVSTKSCPVFSTLLSQVFPTQSCPVFSTQSCSVFSTQSGPVFSTQSCSVFSTQSYPVFSTQSCPVFSTLWCPVFST